jgi:cysteine desulfurase / selenocysteine lyase
MHNYYFDNAATSWPKPESVYKSAENQMRNIYGNPGRSGHTRTLDADRLLYKTREAVAKLFNVKDPARIVFTLNATDSLNLALKGFLTEGSHVIHTAMDHNSVLRPLGRLINDGIINTTTIPCNNTGHPELDILEKSYLPETKLLVINHASNVTGTIAPLKTMISSAHRRDVKVLVDAAQTAGSRYIDVDDSDIDMLAFTGHKGLLGPTGTGGLYVKTGINLKPLREGGTGSQSELDSQPESMPERLEAGTMNSFGLAGLLEGINFILETGINNIIDYEHQIREYLYNKIVDLPGVNIYGPSANEESSSIISISINNADCGEIGFILENNYQILCRTGLHCAPLAHKAIGTFPEGTIRLSPGLFTTREDIDYLVNALEEILCLIK